MINKVINKNKKKASVKKKIKTNANERLPSTGCEIQAEFGITIFLNMGEAAVGI